MIEVALVRLVGAGLTLMAEGYGEAVPPRAVEQGYQLIDFLARQQIRDTDLPSFVGDIVGDIWQRWSEAQLPRSVALAHVDALPSMMDRFRPQDGFLTSMIVSALTTARQGGTSGDQSARVAEVIVGKARVAGAIGAQNLSEQILHFFLERLLARLFADIGTVAQFRPLLQRYLAEGGWRVAAAPVATASGQAEQSLVEEATGSEPAPVGPGEPADEGDFSLALEALAATAATPGRRGEITDGLVRLTAELAAVETLLLPGAIGLVGGFRAELAAGRFDEAGHILGRLEDLHVQAAQRDLGASRGLLTAAAAMRSARAELDSMLGVWRRAARHYGQAVRCLHQADRLGRWRYHVRQAEALVRHGREHGDQGALAEAVQVYASAAGLISEQEAPFEWATTNATLGALLLSLGESEGRSERLRAAALHFRPAIDVFSGLKVSDDWARAQLGLGRALQVQGFVQGDVVTLGEAEFAFRAALGIATPDRMPEEWAEALLALAATLVKLGEETGDAGCYSSAAAAYRTLLAAQSAAGRLYDAVEVKLQLGEVLLAAARLTPETVQVEEAAGIYRSILDQQADVAQQAALRSSNGLGAALWMLGERRQDLSLLSDAARAKLAVLDRLEATGAEDEAARLRGDLADLEQAIARLASAAPAEAAA